MKVLFAASVMMHLKLFHTPYMKWFKEQGWEVHAAASGNEELSYCDKKYILPLKRSPFKKDNLAAFRQLKEIMAKEGYDIIHCNTPITGLLVRLAARLLRNRNSKMIYTAHGFHFYKGSPLINWLIYYPIEKIAAKWTDVLITINEEDYLSAQSFRTKGDCPVRKVHGVGVDLQKFQPQNLKEKMRLRKLFGYSTDAYILFYAAELNSNKHQDLLVRSAAMLKPEIPNVILLLAGEGILKSEYKNLAASLGVQENIQFLGYRNDIPDLLRLSDVAVASSKREGLPVNILEAMAVGLPLVVTNCRGHRDLVVNDVNGLVVELNDSRAFSDAVLRLYHSKELCEKFRERSLELVKPYTVDSVITEMSEIYKGLF